MQMDVFGQIKVINFLQSLRELPEKAGGWIGFDCFFEFLVATLIVMSCNGHSLDLKPDDNSGQILIRAIPGQPSVRASAYPGTN